MLRKNVRTGLLEVLAAEDRMQRGGSEEKEGERIIKVKRSRKGNRLETGETDRRMEAMEAMVVEMRRIVDGVEALVAGQQEIITGIDEVVEEQRSLGFGVEVLQRKIEEGMGEKSKGKEKEMEKGKGKEKGVETERITEEMVMEGDGEWMEMGRMRPDLLPSPKNIMYHKLLNIELFCE